MEVLTVANLKGGTTKTTCAVFLAHALHGQGHSVLFADADPPGSALRWSELAGWPVPAIGLAVKDIHRRLPAIAADYGYAVVDTPPLEDQAGIVASAVRAADHVVIPVAPTTMELDRLSPIMNVISDVEPLRSAPVLVSVLLSRVRRSASSASVAREAIAGAGYHVLDTEIPLWERFGQAFGAAVRAEGTPFVPAADQILKRSL